MDHVLQIELDRYIHEVYVPREREKSPGPAAEEKGQDPFYLGGEGLSLSDLVLKVGETFHEMLFRKIAESGMSEAEVYKKAGIDRKLFSKIRTNPAYHPRKHTVISLALARELSPPEAEEFLKRAGYAFSPGSKSDLIVKFFISHGVYDLMQINAALNELGEDTLGS